MRATCCVEPSMNSSPASSYAFPSSSSTRSESRAVISPMRYVSILTPASSIAARTAVSGSSIRSYTSSLPRSRSRARSSGASLRGTSAPRTSADPRSRRHRLVERVDAVQQAPELEAPEHLAQLRAVRRREYELGRIAVEVEVPAHRGELLRRARVILVLGQVLPPPGRQLVE